jgi:ribose-phosphate pyrophosphokinase
LWQSKGAIIPSYDYSSSVKIAGDVEGRICILIDDMVDTAGTLCQAASILKEKGAKKVVACFCCIFHELINIVAIQRGNYTVLRLFVVSKNCTNRLGQNLYLN